MTFAELQQIAQLRRLRTLPKKASLVARIVDNEIRRANKIGPPVSRKFSTSSGSPGREGGGGLGPELGTAERHEQTTGRRTPTALQRVARRVPVEVWSLIFERAQDWELAVALGLPTRLKMPREWADATELDMEILSGCVSRVRKTAEANPTMRFTEPSLTAAVRFGYAHVLDYLFHHRRPNFRDIFETDDLQSNEIAMRIEVPWLASRYGRTNVLDWWYQNSCAPPAPLEKMDRKYDRHYLNMASQFGHISVLEWWKRSGLPLIIGDVMDFATIGGQLHVLDWWLRSGYNTNMMQRDAIGIASSKGKLDILEWFKSSGMQLNYETDILNVATKANRHEVLQWWEDSGLRIEYTIADIQEAVEECHGTEARRWWEKRGISFSSSHDISPDELFKTRLLRPEQLSKGEP